MFDYIVLLFAFAGFVALTSLAIYGALCFKNNCSPSKVVHKRPVVQTTDGKWYELVGRTAEHVQGVRTDGVGFMLLSERNVKPEYVQTVREFRK